MNWFLLPFALLFWLIVNIRNKLFDFGILNVETFDVPIISIGNITVGGTGKTPHTEYLVKLLKEKYRIATLSRGYKRKTKGFLKAKVNSKVNEVGDEPLQMKNKFSDITVAVDEKRVNGVNELLKQKKKPQIILLDDAFQHRHIKPGLNILLMDYNRPITKDHLLPVGKLREPARNMSRAHVIIVTKCPSNLKPIDFRLMQKDLNIYPYQNLFFTTFKYNSLKPVFNQKAVKKISNLNDYTALVVTGIANPQPIYKQLEHENVRLEKLAFSDHHVFSDADVRKITAAFMNIKTQKKIIICTEKDAMRLKDISGQNDFTKLPIYYLPIEVEFLNQSNDCFNEILMKFIGKYTTNSQA